MLSVHDTRAAPCFGVRVTDGVKAAYHVAAVEQSDQHKLRRPLSATVSGESEGTVGVMNTNISVGSAGARRGAGRLKIHVWSKHASIHLTSIIRTEPTSRLRDVFL